MANFVLVSPSAGFLESSAVLLKLKMTKNVTVINEMLMQLT